MADLPTPDAILVKKYIAGEIESDQEKLKMLIALVTKLEKNLTIMQLHQLSKL